MKYAKKLRKGDKVAIVSLSSGMLGEAFCSHNIEIGVKRLREYGLEPSFMPNSLKGIEYLKANPKARAKDLKDAFMDDSIAGIICAIGGDDTYRLLPYLLEDEEFIDAVHKSPKLFTGFSDTTINHLMFYKLGLSTYYGPNFICDLAEISDEMLPYSKKAFESYIEGNEYREITSSEIWYQERTDFSKEAVGTERISHKEEHGFELLQGKDYFEGRLLGGCLESLYDILTTTRYENEKAVCEKYGLFPDIAEWKEKILFIETCEEKPVPEQFEKEVAMIKKKGVFDVVSGVLVGKPQDEEYYEEYKDILVKVVNDPDLPIIYNVNFGHATPRCVLQYGAMARVDMKQKKIKLQKDNAQLEIQQEKLRSRIDQMVQSEKLLQRDVRKYDEEPEWQLPEPGAFASAKSFRDKIALPLVNKLKELVKSLTIQCVRLKEEVLQLRDKVKHLTSDVEFYKGKIRDMSVKTELLQEKADDLERVKRYAGAEQIDTIIGKVKEKELMEHQARQNHRSYGAR